MKDQLELLSEEHFCNQEWVGMPEFNMKPVVPYRTIKISFTSKEDVDKFGEIIGQNIVSYENYWFPKLNIKSFSKFVYVDKP